MYFIFRLIMKNLLNLHCSALYPLSGLFFCFNIILKLIIDSVNHSDMKLVDLKLHEIEQLIRLLLNSSLIKLLSWKTDNKIIRFNPTAEYYFGEFAVSMIF